MTKDEVKRILFIISNNYPKDYESTDLKIITETWYEIFKGYDNDLVHKAVMNHIALSTFAPKPAHIIEQIQKMTTPEPMNEMEAFDRIMKAVERSSWHSEEEFDKLPDLLKRVVGDPNQLKDWAQMSVADIERYVQPNVVRAYRTEVDRDQDYKRLPADVRERIDQINRPRIYKPREHTPLIEDSEPLSPEESAEKIEKARLRIAE